MDEFPDGCLVFVILLLILWDGCDNNSRIKDIEQNRETQVYLENIDRTLKRIPDQLDRIEDKQSKEHLEKILQEVRKQVTEQVGNMPLKAEKD